VSLHPAIFCHSPCINRQTVVLSLAMKPRAFAAIIGFLFLVVGLFIGFKSTSVPITYGTAQCGSAFAPSTITTHDFGAPTSAESPTARCDDTLGTRKTITFVLIGVGVLTVIGAMVIQPTRTPQTA
jgi:hypothetical protein